MNYELLSFKGKRPNNSKGLIKKELIAYLKEEYKKGHFPSKREIQNKFRLRIDYPIRKLYEDGNLKYTISANQDIKYKKASLLLKIILHNLLLWKFELIKYRNVNEQGIDIIVKKGLEIIGIELKAYNKFERLKKKDIAQVVRLIKTEGLNRALVITTTCLQDANLGVPDNIKIINGDDLSKFFPIEKYEKEFNFILEKSINQENIVKNIKRQKILMYVQKSYFEQGKKPTYFDIQHNLHMDVYTYFKSLFEIYKSLQIPPPTKRMGGPRAKNPDNESIELWKKEFKKYILRETKRGRYPSGEEIGKHFGISHIWNIVKVSELYKEVNLKPYLERGKGSRKTTSAPDAQS